MIPSQMIRGGLLPGGGAGQESKYSMLLDGSNEAIDISNSVTDLSSTTTGTWNFWAKPTDYTASTQVLLSFSGPTNDDMIRVYTTSNGKVNAFCRDDGANQWQVSTDGGVLTNDVWSKITLIHNGTEPRLLIDDAEVAQSIVLSNDNTTWLNDIPAIDRGRWGRRSGNEDLEFPGNLDELTIFSTDMANDEAANLTPTVDANDHAKAANLVQYIRAGEGADFNTTAANEWHFPDDSGSGNTAESINMELEDRVEVTP